MLTTKEAAAAMNGREYGDEMPGPFENQTFVERLSQAGLICLFGYSDDVVELRGVENDELGTDDLHFTSSGLIKNDCSNDECPYFANRKIGAAIVEVFEGGDDFGMFEFRTTIPHERFNIMEDGDLYSSGIVFALADVPA